MSRNPRTDSPRGIDERPSRPRLLSLLFWIATLTLSATAAKGQTCEPHWSDEFPAGDLSSAPVLAITVFDDDSGTGPAPYVGGGFDTGGGLRLNNVAKLMPNNAWAPLANGTNGGVRALVTFDDGLGTGEALYAGGGFSNAGRVEASHIAKWDGESWSSLGEGTDGLVYSLAVFDDGSGAGAALYAAGFFNIAGGAGANNIARWDGQTWSPLGAGIDGPVRRMIVFDDGLGGGPALYVAGSFDNAGGVSARNIAKWDGEAWLAVGGGTNDTIRGLTVFDDGSGPALYAGGYLTEAGGVEVLNVAKWDGLEWSPVGGGTDSGVTALGVFDDGSDQGPALYAGGSFNHAGGVYTPRIAKWDGKEWSDVGGGVNSFTYGFGVFEDKNGGSTLFVGGSLTEAGMIDVRGLAKWDGVHWLPAGRGLVGAYGGVALELTVVEDGSDLQPGLYVAGGFFTAGGVWSPNVARWIEGEWSAVGGGLGQEGGAVRALTVFDDGSASGPSLYAGGHWFASDGGEFQRTAKWDGKTWSELGSDVDQVVRDTTVFDDGLGGGPLLYVVGDFLNAGGIPVDRIATWNGAEWAPLAGGGANDLIGSLIVYDDGSGAGPALYAGGNFTIMSGNIQANFIAKWDGVQWAPLGSGMDSSVTAMAAYDDGTGLALYAGGYFETAGGVEANGIAKWDGKQWSALPGSGIDGPFSYPVVIEMTVFDDGVGDRPALFLAGRFFTAGGVEAKSIARWDGRTWSALGTGLHDINGSQAAAGAIVVFDDGTGDGPALFAGGDFSVAGNFSSQSIAKWIVCADAIPGDLDGDGAVGASDLLILLARWGPCDDCNDCIADLNGDCTVGAGDLLILLANWG